MADRGRTSENPDDDARADHATQPAVGGPEQINGAPRVSSASGKSGAPDTVHPHPEDADSERNRRMRRAQFLADLAEARELRKRVAPRRARAAELHARVLRTFRY
ncbi:MAG TPA: hypothetical protein VGS97_29065 [Actinocrinis sp.]|uniref:hypothetical protein n=1 Tax=Actinocrinis sp. TaxID=1920516 RepID=UPI002DDD5EC5|nr:hypothetical protein [Actinocrinis sp.]HEV2348171.1 hypothetical protein [Actinocrinis sp.]